jgi:hypothetical protein
MRKSYLFSILVLVLGLNSAGCAVIVGPPPGRLVVAPPPVVVEAGPRVVLIPGTRVYYAPETVANVFVVSGVWYNFYGGHWYRGRSYHGPWVFVNDRYVPYGLRRLPPDFRSHSGRG